MSGFDENPFVEPTIDNPFSDPSVQQVISGSGSTQIRVEDYNLLTGPQNVNVRSAYNTEPAVMQATQDPPAYSRSGQQTQSTDQSRINPAAVDTTEFQRRQEELNRKIQEISRREAAPDANYRKNNWPPLPDKCCFQPCFYQDIDREIPTEYNKIVKNLYTLWIFHGCLLLLNVVASIVWLFVQGGFSYFITSILYVLIFTPFSFLCWFRPAYKGFRSFADPSGFSLNFTVFFFVFMVQMIVSGLLAFGFINNCGLIQAIRCFDGTVSGMLSGLFLLSLTLGFAASSILDLLLITRIHKVYRGQGGSIATGLNAARDQVLGNQHFQNAASDVMSAAVQSQVSSKRY